MSDEIEPMHIPPSKCDWDSFSYREWIREMKFGQLNGLHFKKYWAKYVPEIFCFEPECDCLNISFDEDLIYKTLLLPLEQLICDSDDPGKVFQHIENMNNAPSLCGKVFKGGEPTYSCRDCGLDPTCVICVDCFTKSAHRFHRYKMSTSGGGGYCDCGDEEAWKSNGFCDIHHKGKYQDETQSTTNKLPDDLIERTKIIMQVILQYCHTIMNWLHSSNLPHDLQYPDCKLIPDTCCTILFNDETHTYEQVIETLSKAVNCSKKAAIDYATTIDREGRCIVKCSNFSECNQARYIIERVTSSNLASALKVSVVHVFIVSHQIFALKLLAWLHQILLKNEGFRLIFCQVMTETVFDSESNSLLEFIMLSDTRLWKSVRNQWHQLFISGMLMEQNCKKVFARTFAKNYPILIRDFMADDHDHSISVTSLSVQIFTVPTLSYALIEEDDIISVILRTFLSECERNKNEDGKLAFHRNQINSAFRRSHYMLYDLKYLVTVTPTSWNDLFRINFLHGLQCYLSLLNLMQGMDSVTRQVGQHIEYEAEWETGVNLQLKIATISTLLLQWCGSDFHVFIKAFKSTLALVPSDQNPPSEQCFVIVDIAGHSASCIDYDVSSMPVSIHLPLSRFAAGLFLHLEKFDLQYDSPKFQLDNGRKPSAEYLMEYPLRTLVLLAQFRAGMWRRNGYSLLNQIYFYHNVRFRDEMFDRDILMLQIAASMIESNEFLIHLVYKFGLLSWADEKYDGTVRKSEDDNIRQVLNVAEEFLSLLLIIISERYTPGVGCISEKDKLKKEIIQLLCIEPMTHSNLFKMLPKDPNNETGMEDVVNEVANFKKLPNNQTGKYELTPEYYSHFNPFYYHYTKEEQSKAEEAQLKRKKQRGESLCCPPPLPPWFIPRFNIIIDLLQSDVMLHIIHTVLARTLNLHSIIFSEAQFEKVLHIIGVALHEEQRSITHGVNTFFRFTMKATTKGILQLLEECLKSPRIESHKYLLRWVIEEFQAVRCYEAGGIDKLKRNSLKDESSPESSKSQRNKADAAAARKARIMAQMTSMQKLFIKENRELYNQAVLEDGASVSQSSVDTNTKADNTDDPICIGSRQRGKVIIPKIHNCMLCREDQEVSCTGRVLVYAAFVQRSSVLSKNRRTDKEPNNYDPSQLVSDVACAPHTSTCGHVMHSDCWQKFFESVLRKEQRRPLRFGRHTSFEVDKNEYLCPLCERLCNTVIPIIPQLSTLIPKKNLSAVNISIDNWLSAMKKTAQAFQVIKLEEPPDDDDKDKYMTHQYLPLKVVDVLGELPESVDYNFSSLFSLFHDVAHECPEFSENLMDMMKHFAQTTYTVGLQCNPNSTDVRISAMSWWSCAYTIHSIEWLLREQDKPLFGKLSSRNASCLEAMVRFTGCSLRIFDENIVRTRCGRLLRYLLLGEYYLSTLQCSLDVDAFSVLIFLVLSMPILFTCDENTKCSKPILCPLGSDLDAYLMHLLYIFHLVQIVLTASFSEEENMDVECTSNAGDELSEDVAAHFYRDVRTASGLDPNGPSPSGFTLVRYIQCASLPFLRCAALFFHVLTDTAPPFFLQGKTENEFEHICKYLGLPTTLEELLSSPSLKQLALSWARHPRTLHLLQPPSDAASNGSKDCLVHQPLSVNHLVKLPRDYSDLINSASLFTCPNSDGDDSRNPTMCLVCGQVLCSQSYCCQTELGGTMVGACTYHAHYCGAGIGIFLRIRDCKILLLSDKNKGCFMAPPYVDDYGETDLGLLRGNPLHLCNPKYEELNELWLSHNIPEQVSHMMEQSTALPNWQLL